MLFGLFFFFFKQKTAYEMRISDWSSDVCSSDLVVIPVAHNAGEYWRRNAFVKRPGMITVSFGPAIESQGISPDELNAKVQAWIEGEMRQLNPEIGRASCRERVGQ